MLLTNTIQKRTIGSSIVEQILDLSSSQPNHKILENVDIIGSSNRDGSAVITLEWMGDSDSRPILDFVNKVKSLIISSKREVKEQSPPTALHFNNLNRVTYRFRIWDVEGKYEYMDKTLADN